MSELILYFTPGACSRVPLLSLLEIGVGFETRLVDLASGQQKSEEYLELNPKGKTPLLVVDREPLTENVAIVSYLARAFPEANILPFTWDVFKDAQIMSDLAWCSSGLHPLITRIRLPQKFVDQADAHESVVAKSASDMHKNFQIIDQRLEGKSWIYGDEWSAVDAYLFWVWGRTIGPGFDNVAMYPNYAAHAERMKQRKSYSELLEIEQSSN